MIACAINCPPYPILTIPTTLSTLNLPQAKCIGQARLDYAETKVKAGLHIKLLKPFEPAKS